LRFNVTVDLNIEGNKLRRFNQIYSNVETLPEKIYAWIREIKMETGYRETFILRVSYNDEHDITEVIREIDEAPLE
jgi:hypothetical protein